MYRKDSEGWLKHFDFLVLDMLCLQVAFVLAYGISGYGFYPYNLLIYRNMAIFIEFADIVVLFACGTLKNVLKRGHYREFLVTFQNTMDHQTLGGFPKVKEGSSRGFDGK